MALPNLSGSHIQDTFQRVLHTDGSNFYDGTGSAVLLGAMYPNPDNDGILVYNPNGNYGGKLVADSNFTYDGALFAAQCQNITLTAVDGGINLIGSITMSGGIKAAGTITAGDIVNTSNTTSGLRFNPSSTDVLSNLIVSGSITASGDISSSGIITATSFIGNMDGGIF